MVQRGPESLRTVRLGWLADHIQDGAHSQCTVPGNRASTWTVPLAAHVTSRHLYGFFCTDMPECLGDSPESAPKSPSHLHAVKASCPATSTAPMYSRRPGAWVASDHPTRAGWAGNLKKCLGARAMRRGQGKEAPCFRLDLTGASGPHMSALHYRPAACRPAAAGPLLRSQCLAWVSQPAIMLQPRAVMRTGDTTR